MHVIEVMALTFAGEENRKRKKRDKFIHKTDFNLCISLF